MRNLSRIKNINRQNSLKIFKYNRKVYKILKIVFKILHKYQYSKNYEIKENEKPFLFYLAGGIVRDSLLFKENNDIDIVVSYLNDDLIDIFSKTFNCTFKRYRNFKTASTTLTPSITLDFSTMRSEYYPHRCALPVVDTDLSTEVGILTDILRRDFTINTFIFHSRIVDKLGSIGDLRKGVLRVLHENSFLDDPTRIIRGYKFLLRFSKYNFSFEKNTFSLMKSAINENIFLELEKERIKDIINSLLKEENFKYFSNNRYREYSFLLKSYFKEIK